MCTADDTKICVKKTWQVLCWVHMSQDSEQSLGKRLIIRVSKKREPVSFLLSRFRFLNNDSYSLILPQINPQHLRWRYSDIYNQSRPYADLSKSWRTPTRDQQLDTKVETKDKWIQIIPHHVRSATRSMPPSEHQPDRRTSSRDSQIPWNSLRQTPYLEGSCVN